MAFAAGEGNSLEAIGAYMAAHNPDVHYLLTGCSERGTDHVVICRNGKLVHDPAPEGGGLVGPDSKGWWWVEIVLRDLGT